MSLLRTGFSAIGKLLLLAVLLASFLGGVAGVVYLSLMGEEIKVPEIVGKDFVESEKELAALGLKLKKRADRLSSEKMNTVLEQLPRPGETVKTGQMILVVVSKAGIDGSSETPKSLIKDIESDDTEKIEEMISDKPKRTRSNSNTNSNSNSERKKADTTRDVIGNTATSSNSAGSGGANSQTSPPENSNRREPLTNPIDRPAQPSSTPRTQSTPSINRSGSGETRPRTTPRTTQRP